VNIARDALNAFIDRFNKQFGIICFSATPSDPLLWSHYAKGHTGVVLQVEHAKEELHEVTYDTSCPILDVDCLLHSGIPDKSCGQAMET